MLPPILQPLYHKLLKDREMTLQSEPSVIESWDIHLTQRDLAVLDRFSQLVIERADALAQGPDRLRVLNLVKRAVSEGRQALTGSGGATEVPANTSPSALPVSKLKVSEVVGQGWVGLSQASFYRAVDSKRFYCITPAGRAIGKEFPAWQFVPPVPELIAPVLALFDDMPSSEIHAFWVSEAEELNGMSPAEVLAGLPFATRHTTHTSQWAILRAPAPERARKVTELVEFKLRSEADFIG
ncbi:hypothetical protein [Pseudoduganella aquatica]|uniref:Uncharacterized protein n=1 Tax=Pseudoduganella aquatica TaxID=2660641 RepID=A0A7X4HBS8_9BURK|nr:hypothetical protein [Pseudoduganella aquatica]MYN07958.1 hypothetical protein [Pseudoduganella aquatica]